MAAPRPAPRALWTFLHRWLGLAAIPFLFLAALTGVMLVFVAPLDKALNADLFAQAAVATPPPVERVVDAFAVRHPEWRVSAFPLTVPADERIPVDVEPTREGAPDQVFLDRATGAVMGQRSTHAAWSRHGAAEQLLELHAHLLLGTPGRVFMGLVALVWLIGHGVGFYLTFPVKRPFWKGWARSWKVSRRSPFGRIMLDWHKASALWLFVPLTALAATSVALNFFAEAYGPVVEALYPEAPPAVGQPVPGAGPLDFTRAVALARKDGAARVPGWQPSRVLVDHDEKTIGVTLSDDGRINYHALGPVYLWFDAGNGALKAVQDPYHGDSRLAGYRLLYPVHSGRVGGNATLLLAVLSGLATMGLCVTGVYVWWKKRASRRAQKRALALR